MSDKLQEIEKQIEDAQQRKSTLEAEFRDLRNRLTEKLAEQKTAILEGKPTGKLESEIQNTRTKIEGTKAALKSMAETLGDLQAQQAAELRAIGNAQAEKVKTEIIGVLTDIYSLFAKITDKITELKAKHIEYLAALKATDPKTAINHSRKIGDLVHAFQNEIPKLLEVFPADIFADEKLPMIAELRRSLKQ